MLIDRRNFIAVLASTACLLSSESSLRASSLFDARSVSSLASDPRRPQFHLLPPANWMNDPNGPIFWNGHYHMFYQYNPDGAFWGDMHWGHSSSSDMVHWKHLNVALAPTPGGPDADGCFSGTAVVQDGKVVLLYTAVRSAPEAQATIKDGAHSLLETQCLATTNDPELRTWTKLPSPVIATPPRGLDVTGFRDPSPWRVGDVWYAVIGSGIVGEGGAVLLYRSKDLRNWEYMHILAQRKGSIAVSVEHQDSREVWECPDLFALGAKHVLIYSAAGRAFWMAGTLDLRSMRYEPDAAGVLDYGSFYAPKTQLDRSGNRVLWGWIPETRPLAEYKAAGWAGLMSLPRILSMGKDNRLSISVAENVNELRGAVQDSLLTSDESHNRKQLEALRLDECAGEIHCTVHAAAEPFQLLVGEPDRRITPENTWITISFNPAFADRISIDDKYLPLGVQDRKPIDISLYLDGSVIEVFVNKQTAYTKRFYVNGDGRHEVGILWQGKTNLIDRLSFCPLRAISDDRLTT